MKHSVDTWGYVLFIGIGLLLLTVPICLVLSLYGIDVVSTIGTGLAFILICGVIGIIIMAVWDYFTTPKGTINPWT